MASWMRNRKPPPSTAGTVGTKKGPDEKLRAIFQHFDDNDDGYLSYQELRRLQLQTSGDDLDGPTFCALCEEFKCQPSRGLTLDALRATYEDGDGIDGGAEGSASIEEDYDKIFPDGEEDVSGGDSQGEGEEGGDVEDAIFRELMGKQEDQNDPQQAASSNDAKQAEKGGHSKTVWTDVELKDDQSAAHDEGSADVNSFRACNVDTATKVRALHKHFDLDGNKFLNYSELSALQLATSGEHLEGPEYCHLCRENQCDPRKGLSVKALQKIYQESGIDHLNQDYDKIFDGKDPKELMSAATPQKPAVNTAVSTSSFGISLPELPSPSYLSNMLFGSGFGGAVAHDIDSSEVAHGGDVDMAQDDEGGNDADQKITGEDEEEGDGEESLGLLARISLSGSPGRSKPLHVDDHVRTLHQFFDIYNTGRLGYCELRNMQLRTSGDDLEVEEYRMICEELGVDPREGLSVEALQQTYSSGGGNISADYKKVFPSESVAAMFSSPEVKDLGVNLHGDYPFLAAERLEKISLIFKYFDEDQNGLLSYRELRELQLQTSGEDMDGPQFSTVCSMYKCDPHDGLTIENLRDIYTSQGVDSSLDDDYRKIYRRYVWSLQKKSNIKQEELDKKKGPRIERAGSHEGVAAKKKEDEDELTQESGEGSMEKRPLPESSD